MEWYIVRDGKKDSELRHHGIEGQQWGVRRGPPYPIQSKTMRKGEHLRSVEYQYGDADKYKKSGRAMYTYNANDEWDNNVYKGPFSKYNIVYNGARFIAEHEYELVKDLKMPTKEERIDEFKDIYKSDKYGETARKEIQSALTTLIETKYGTEEEQRAFRELDLNNIKTEEEWETAYKVFNALTASKESNKYKTTSEYMKRMSSKYDAMVDDNDQGQYNAAHDPVIIFRADEALKTVSTKFLTVDDILKSYDYVYDELAKQGVQVTV